MACSCQNQRRATYVWTSDDGSSTVIYPSKIQAEAAVMRKGGSYTKKE